MCIQACKAVLFVIFLCCFSISCSKAVPPLPPNVSGVSDAAVYGAAILIDIRSPQENVSYAAMMDGRPFELGSLYGEDGKHTLTVTANGKKGNLTSRTVLKFEIDKIPPPAPEITGVEEGKNYNTAVRVFALEEKGTAYTAGIDGQVYILGSEYDKEGRHELKVTALKKRNGLTAVKTIPFSIDSTSYTADEISYFREVAFGSEFGGRSDTIRKWQNDILVKVIGRASREDLESLSRVISDLNEIIDPLEIRMIDNSTKAGESDKIPNMSVYYIPNAEFVKHTSEKLAFENWGLFFYYGNAEGAINEAKVLIAVDKANMEERAHLIREEFTQALGLAQDSEKYRNSIFYQGWTTTQKYSEMDKRLISMLYIKDILPNMTEKDAVSFFQSKHADNNDRYQVFPTDQSAENPSFVQFAKELQSSIAHRDLNDILQYIDVDFTAEPLEGKGDEAFKKYFSLESNPEQSNLWRLLGDALKFGGVFTDHALSAYEAPYTKERFPKQLDPDIYKAAILPSVKVHQYPDEKSAVLDTLRFDAVRILQPQPPAELPSDIDLEDVFKWEYVETFSGKKGYVPIEQMRSPAADIFTFKKKNNRWLISAISNQ